MPAERDRTPNGLVGSAVKMVFNEIYLRNNASDDFSIHVETSHNYSTNIILNFFCNVTVVSKIFYWFPTFSSFFFLLWELCNSTQFLKFFLKLYYIFSTNAQHQNKNIHRTNISYKRINIIKRKLIYTNCDYYENIRI